MEKEVGAELEGATFGKVIFLVVSKLPDFKKLQGEIARNLDLKLENGMEEVPHDKILTKIKALKEKLLIALDDVWMEFDPTKALGIPPPHLYKGCTILTTTQIKEICTEMDCQRKSLARNIVKRCLGLPAVIVVVARSLKGRPSMVWKEALRNLQSGEPIFNVRDNDLKGVYEGLKLSYDNLKNEKAKKILLISSLFPEDFEIPMEFLIRIGVGMDLSREVDNYSKRRRKVLDTIGELLDSALLLNAERECVKMHDLVHEVALLIGEKDVQSVIESNQPKKGLQYLFWKSNSFPRHFDGRNLEVLLWVLDNSEDLEVPNTLFTKMKKLRGLSNILFDSHYNLCNLKTLKLDECPNLTSIFLPSTAQSLLQLEELKIERCDALERIVTSEEADVAVSTRRLLDEGIPQGLLASKKWIDTASTLVRQLALHVRHIRKMTLACLSSNLVSTLFTLSMASVISWEELTIMGYDYKDEINCSSIFRKLQKLDISWCEDLEFLFLSTISIEIKNLKSLTIGDAPQLTYVIEKYQHQHCLSNQNKNDEWHFDLPALEALCFGDELDASVEGVPPFLVAQSLLVQSLKNVREIELKKSLKNLEIEDCKELEFVFQSSIPGSLQKLKSLTIREVPELKYVVGNYQQDQQNDDHHFDLPALENLTIIGALEINSFCAKNYKMDLSSLQNVVMMNCSVKSFDDYDMVNLTTTEVHSL
ncbi:disease resistance protein SUMM2-like [Neltuma alba]|uniref:disease resistance protein SUMM2-like n=1 Tax=Neltuma alba TaxID=207710 RepID=UPI0010A3EE54|nr:disease resistance protein SUMM2-like [Prosopis alba]